MNQAAGSKDPRIISYTFLRRAIGGIGMTLPFVLAFGLMFAKGYGFLDSISDYYHSRMGDVFVGAVCAIAIFLLAYRGYDRDNIVGNFACFFGVGLALIPNGGERIGILNLGEFSPTVHLILAAGFFLTLAYISYFLFTKSKHSMDQLPHPKKMRNRVYKTCAWIMVGCLLGILIVNVVFPDAAIQNISPVFLLESIAIFVFGVSWIIKGNTLFADS